MDYSFADYLIHKYSSFLDPFSMTEINTERLCYPVSYANEDMIKGLESINKGKDMEDDILVRQSILKDFPDFEKAGNFDSFIADGAAHILNNKNKEPIVQLIGMPKTGKTSLLKKIVFISALQLKANPNSFVPVLVNSEIFAQASITGKMELIEACFTQFEEFEAYLREKFFAGKIILLLDEMQRVGGLNVKIVEWIFALKTFVNIPLCVFSSRYAGYTPIINVPVLVLDIYPIKLQIAMAQHMLSELQFDRFIEKATSNNSNFSEFASTPYLFSLLLEMFRWGIVGIENNTSRGKLFYFAIRYLLAELDQCKYWQGIELLAADMLLRDTKIFNLYDLKNLELEEIWFDIKDLDLFLPHEDAAKLNTPKASEIDENSNVSNDEAIGEIKDTPLMPSLKGEEAKDATPKWVSNSKENYITYQIARNCIEKDIFNSFYNEGYRFVHLRYVEILTAQYYVNQVEDSLLHTNTGFLMESSAFQKAFNNCFPNNFLFSRRYREVLLLFASICSENIFENLIKYLLNKGTFEHCYIAEILLKERGYSPNHRPLLNKFKQDKQELCKKNFVKAFWHPSSFMRKITKCEALENGFSESELAILVNKNSENLLKNMPWLYLKQLSRYSKETNTTLVKSLFSRLLEITLQIISSGSKPSISKIILHKVLLSMLISVFDRDEINSVNQSFSQSFIAPASSEDPKVSEEITVRISFDKLKIPRNELTMIERIGSSHKLVLALDELVQNSSAIDVNSCVRLLILLGCSISRIHNAISCRFQKFTEHFEKIEVLKVLKILGFVTQQTIEIPLICLQNTGELKSLSKEILKLLNVEKLKKYAISILMKDDSSSFKLLLALRALKFTRRPNIDEEVLYLLVQFIDHYCLELRYEAISSLYGLLKSGEFLENAQLQKILAASPHVLRDRLKLIKYDVNLRIISLKCLVSLWICLDKGRKETNSSAMHHILVKDYIHTNFIVGNITIILNLLKEFLSKSSEERIAAWKSLHKMSPILSELEGTDYDFFLQEMFCALDKNHTKEEKIIILILTNNEIHSNHKHDFVELLLNVSFDKNKDLLDPICSLLVRWSETNSLKSLISPLIQIGEDLGNTLEKLQLLIDCLDDYQDFTFTHANYKNILNWHKSLINQLAENMHWPAKLFPHCNQLLDISADPSFFQNDSLPEISGYYPDMDSSMPKVSMDSANSDQDEAAPPIDILYQLALAGIRSDGLKYWILWYLRNCYFIEDFFKAAKSWSLISGQKDFYNPQVEIILIKLLQEYPDETCAIVEHLKFKSDSFSLKIIDIMVKGKAVSEICRKALSSCMELNTSVPLEEVYKMLWITTGDIKHLFFLNKCAVRVMKNILITTDNQLNSVLKALSSSGCSLLVQPIWVYIIGQIKQRSSYTLSQYTVGIMENSTSWDCKYLLSRFKILGLLPVDPLQKECGSSMSTKKI